MTIEFRNYRPSPEEATAVVAADPQQDEMAPGTPEFLAETKRRRAWLNDTDSTN